jgi:hypothetical protein
MMAAADMTVAGFAVDGNFRCKLAFVSSPRDLGKSILFGSLGELANTSIQRPRLDERLALFLRYRLLCVSFSRESANVVGTEVKIESHRVASNMVRTWRGSAEHGIPAVVGKKTVVAGRVNPAPGTVVTLVSYLGAPPKAAVGLRRR